MRELQLLLLIALFLFSALLVGCHETDDTWGQETDIATVSWDHRSTEERSTSQPSDEWTPDNQRSTEDEEDDTPTEPIAPSSPPSPPKNDDDVTLPPPPPPPPGSP